MVGAAAAGLCVGCVGAGAVFLLLRRETPAADVAHHAAAAFGLPSSSETLRVHDAFVACWDARTRNPRWVAERLTAASCSGTGDRSGVAFREDAQLPARFRSSLDDFARSGFDRGHHAASANHKGSQEAVTSTFTLVNVSPQVGEGFNRSYWARLEKWVRDLTDTYSAVHVVTGPLFLPVPSSTPGTAARWAAAWPALGRPPFLVAAPTHFFKVILTEQEGKNESPRVLGAFVLPNAPIPPTEPLARFAVPLASLEAAAGLSFFDTALGGPSGEARSRFAQAESHVLRALPTALPPPRPDVPLLLLPSAPEGATSVALAAARSAGTTVSEPELWRAAAAAAVAEASAADVPVPLCAALPCALPEENWWRAKRALKQA